MVYYKKMIATLNVCIGHTRMHDSMNIWILNEIVINGKHEVENHFWASFLQHIWLRKWKTFET